MLKNKIKKYYDMQHMDENKKLMLANELRAAYGDDEKSNTDPLISVSSADSRRSKKNEEVYARGTGFRTVTSLAAVLAIVVGAVIYVGSSGGDPEALPSSPSQGVSPGGNAGSPGGSLDSIINGGDSKPSYDSIPPKDDTLFMHTDKPTVKLEIDGYDREGVNNNEIFINGFEGRYTSRAKLTYPEDLRSISMTYISNGFYGISPLCSTDHGWNMDDYGYVVFDGFFIEYYSDNGGLNDTIVMTVENGDGSYSIVTDTLYHAENKELHTTEFLKSFDDKEAYQKNLDAMKAKYGDKAQEYLQLEYDTISFWVNLEKALERYNSAEGYYKTADTSQKECTLDLRKAENGELLLDFYAPACDVDDGHEYVFEDTYNIYVFADDQLIHMVDVESFTLMALEEGLENNEDNVLMYNDLPTLTVNCKDGTRSVSVQIPTDGTAHSYNAVAIPVNSYCGAKTLYDSVTNQN